ncbi:MAG: DUF1549 and DUF1553 domain-containing protein [Gemmataceae bacterium]
MRANRSRFGVSLSLLAFAALFGIALWAHDNAAEAQDGKKKGAKAAAKKEAAKKGTTKPAPFTPRVTLVKGKKLDASALAGFIDEAVNARLKAEGIPASARAGDTEFLRRVSLDLTGVIPSPERVRAFLDDTNPNKREALIDELLKSERFGKYHAEQWAGLMIPRESNNRVLKHEPLQNWLAKDFNDNVPLSKLVYDLVTATGSQEENGAVTYFVGNPTVDKMTDNVTRMFLGVQLQCAQCHNHPFVDWKQNEYWAMAAFFMKTKLTATPQAAAKKGVPPGIIETSAPAKGKKGNLPESAKFVPAKFLQGESPKLDPKEPYRPVLAKWITSADNPFFARAMVNRWWHTMFGRGIVNPVDDMHEENGPTHPELLDALTDQLKLNNFDLRYLLKAICLSETYQRTSMPTDKNKEDTALYSHRLVRVMTPEQLYDSLSTVVGLPKGGPREKLKAPTKKGPTGPRENFLAFFRIDEGADTLEYQAGIPQALRLMNSAPLNNFAGTIAKASESSKAPEKVIENLFLATYNRRPTAAETKTFTAYVARQPNPQTAYGDICWSLINSSEFSMNH